LEIMHWCAYCRMMTETKTIKIRTPYSHRLSGYSHVCPSCIEKHGLENVPEYTPTNLESMVDRMGLNAFMVGTLTSNDKEYLILTDNHGEILHTNELKIIAEELLKTIKLPDLDEFIKKENFFEYLRELFPESSKERGKFFIPVDALRIRRKKFRGNIKRDWGFTCGNCSKKVSSKEDKEYLTINPTNPIPGHGEYFSVRACSKGCMKVIAKDFIWNWLTDNNLKDYFDTTNLDKDLDEYLKEV